MTETLNHPTLGAIHGKALDGQVHFLGLKYASLRDRLAEPELIDKYGTSPIDATKLGPQALSPPNAIEREFGFMQQKLPYQAFEVSDLDALHLNIAVPNGAKNSPVMVFIHGGGFMIGSNAWPQYDWSRLVQLSVDLGMPFIGVSINYRVGAAGFLTSKELQDAGYKSNNGLRDQRTALQWVKKNIAGFGGNPERVTLAGQSAGGVGSMLQLQSPEPLFQQLVDFSGTPLLLRPLPPPVSEFAYSLVAKALGIEGLSSEERIQKLVNGPASDLYAKITPAIPLIPVLDGDFLKVGPTFQALAGSKASVEADYPGAKWCNRLLIGDCRFDGHIFKAGLEPRKQGIAKAFHESLKKSLSSHPSKVEEIERSYDINAKLSDNAALKNILEFATDIGFSAPPLAIADAWPGQSFLYHLNEPNTWEGPCKGEATHIFDLVLLFQTFNEHLSSEQREQAKRWAEAVITFVAGKEPFPSRQSEPTGAMVYGPPAKPAGFIKSKDPKDFGRRDTVQKLAQDVGLDALSMAWVNFLSGQ